MTSAEAADVIVVGGGTAGCVVAAELSRDPHCRVLMIEAGPEQAGLMGRLPMGYGKLYFDRRYNWAFDTAPEPGLNGRRIYVPRGKLLGGSGSINALVWSRGQAVDYEDWVAMGATGWDWAAMERAFLALEDHELAGNPAIPTPHGKGGPIHITHTGRAAHKITDAFIAAAPAIGLSHNPDLNAYDLRGLGHYQINTRNDLRVSSRTAWLDAARARPNLRVLTGVQVTRVHLTEGRATGVSWQGNGQKGHATARAGVVVSAGSIGTPHLLQLSGLGHGDWLQKAGIQPYRHLPAIGAGLQDHSIYDHLYHAKVPTLNQVLRPLIPRLLAGLQWLLGLGGPLSISVNHGGGFVQMDDDPRSMVQLYFSPISFTRARQSRTVNARPDPFPAFYLSISPSRPKSRGWVRALSPDPMQTPEIVTNMLTDADDMALAVRAAKLLYQLAAAPSLAGLISGSEFPLPDPADEAALAADIRQRAYSVYHPVGSCAMGEAGALDPELRVRGVDGLWVIDSSAFPCVTSANVQAPTFALAWRGAQMLRQALKAG